MVALLEILMEPFERMSSVPVSIVTFPGWPAEPARAPLEMIDRKDPPPRLKLPALTLTSPAGPDPYEVVDFFEPLRRIALPETATSIDPPAPPMVEPPSGKTSLSMTVPLPPAPPPSSSNEPPCTLM